MKAAELYFSEEASYRAVGRELGIDPHTAWGWIQELGANCKSFEEVAEELKPQWSGYLLADGKSVFVKGVEHALLLTGDVDTQDIPYASFHLRENAENWMATFLAVRDTIRYPIQGIVIDGDLGLVRACKVVYPSMPLQLCVRHVESFLSYYLKYKLRIPEQKSQPFLQMAHKLLYVQDKDQLEHYLQEYTARRRAFQHQGLGRILLIFESKFRYLWTHLDHPGMPRTSNIIEGIIRQLSRKIADTDGFETPDSAWNTLKLLIMNYRFHSFSCSRIPGHNGFSPLELARVRANGNNWVLFSQKAEAT